MWPSTNFGDHVHILDTEGLTSICTVTCKTLGNTWFVGDMVPPSMEFSPRTPDLGNTAVVVARRVRGFHGPLPPALEDPRPDDEAFVKEAEGNVWTFHSPGEATDDDTIWVWSSLPGTLVYESRRFTDRVFHKLQNTAYEDPVALESLLDQVPADALRIGLDVNGMAVTLTDLTDEYGVTFADVARDLENEVTGRGRDWDGEDEEEEAKDSDGDSPYDFYELTTFSSLVQGGTVRSAVLRWFAYFQFRDGDDRGDVVIRPFPTRIYPDLGVRHNLVNRGLLSVALENQLKQLSVDEAV